MNKPYEAVVRLQSYPVDYTVWDAYSNGVKIGAFIHKKGRGLRFYPDKGSFSMPEMAKIVAMTEHVQRVCKYLTLGRRSA